ncbi:MAG TPA: cytochrome c [Candidatus Acidoferrum sp.]
MSKLTVYGATALLLFVGVVAAAQQQKEKEKERQGDGTVYAEIGKAPEKWRAKRNPMEKDPEAVTAGSILFEEHCAECHGTDAQGSRKAPSLRVEEVQSAPPGALFWVLTNGVVRRGMPVWSKLPEPQRWQLVSYLKSLAPAKERPQPAADKP